jgi:Secretion system C-terminal sorting domain
MKKNIPLCLLPSIIILAIICSPWPVLAQCTLDTYYHDPHGAATLCGTTVAFPAVTSFGTSSQSITNVSPNVYSSNSCLSSSNSSGFYYVYTFTMAGNNYINDFDYCITGGYVFEMQAHYISGSQGTTTYDQGQYNTNCDPNGGAGSMFGLGITYNTVTIYVRWTTQSASNNLQFFGYYGPANSGYGSISYFTAITMNTASQPLAPAYISLSSPVCSVPGWEVFPGYVSNATSYYWQYSGPPYMGGTMGSYSNSNSLPHGPTIPNSNNYPVTVYLDVKAVNGCTSSQLTYGSVSIPGANQCGYGYSVSPSLFRDSASGDFDSRKSGIIVYPNPASNNATVLFSRPGQHTIELFTASGQTIRILSTGSSTQDIDLSHLQKGIYIVVVRENGAISFREKLIVH